MPATAKKKAASRAAKKPRAQPLPVVQVPLEKIDPSPRNRDAKTDIAALAASIASIGMQQAIKLRPKGDRYEIVYGERRWRAVKHLGYSTIDATVEELDDVRAAEIRAIENLQRKDPHALEEAEEYERLLALRDSKGKAVHTPETISKIAGRSVGHVYNRLKLTALAPGLRKALYKHELSLTGAFLIARGIPTELQAEAWTKMREYAEHEAYDEEVDDEGRLTTRAIQNIIDHEFSCRLATAPFSLKDAKLVAAAGSCDACPQRSGNQPFLFAEKDPTDTCTNVACFRTKVAAYVEREKQRVLAVGGTVLSDDESRRVFQGGCSLPYNSKWVDLDQANHDDAERRTWKKLLGDLCPPPALAFTAQSKPILLAEKAAILATLKEHGLDPASVRKAKASTTAAIDPGVDGARSAVHHDDPEEDDAPEGAEPLSEQPGAPEAPTDQRFAADVSRITRQQVIGAIVAAAEGAGADDNRFVQLVYETMLHGGYHNAIADAVKRRLGPKRPKGEYPATALAEHGAALGPAALRGLLLELAISRSAFYAADGKYPRDLQHAIELYQVDAAALEQAVVDELTAKRAARLAGAKAGGA